MIFGVIAFLRLTAGPERAAGPAFLDCSRQALNPRRQSCQANNADTMSLTSAPPAGFARTVAVFALADLCDALAAQIRPPDLGIVEQRAARPLGASLAHHEHVAAAAE